MMDFSEHDRERFINGQLPQEVYRMALEEFRMEAAISAFADAWADGKDAIAVGCASIAKTAWDAQYLSTTLQNVARERAKRPDERIVWPVPGCPEADEVTGWEGWYGDYPH